MFRLRALVAGAAILAAASPSLAQSAGGAINQPISVEDFVRLPAYAGPTISRNGRWFAVTIPINGRLNLAVVDLETRKGTALSNFSDCDVQGVRWVGNDRLVFTLGQTNTPTGPGQFECGGFFSLTREGKDFRRISSTVKDLRRQNQFVYRGYSFLSVIPGNDEEILAEGNVRDAASADVYRLNVATGRATLITETRPTRTVDFVLDRNRVPRVATHWLKDTNTYVVSYRKDDKSPWEEIARYDISKPGVFQPIRFEADNQILHVATNEGRATSAILRYDPNARKFLDVVVEHPKFDLTANSAIIDPQTDELLGYQVEAERPITTWLTENERRIQRMLDGALPDRYNTFRKVRGDQYLVISYSDRHPVSWYILDEGKRSLEELFSSRPWLAGRQVEMRPFFLKTRDGLEILSYYFLPRNHKPGERLPTVVHIHGGPTVRADFWGRNTFGVTEAQILASRGYAVVVPNFRITPGLGSKNFFSGFGTFGREMLNDHEDAAKWAIEQGFADPKRICISGASYGGYATLMSLARFPQTFACGVAGLVVSDLPLILTSPAGDIPFNEAAVKYWHAILGVNSVSDIPREISPVNIAEQIKQPLFFYAGADDIRTPLEQTTRMVRALERAGNPPRQVLIVPGEGHGFGRMENNVKLYDEMLKFLDATIGPGSKK
ncbi:MAG: prolyl oligopeptidase family serine peptidase [Burkholderiaceae bacterium]|nr:prolyl oligopeptidase family serine peptidase [Burkholderiaceae bacterium]